MDEEKVTEQMTVLVVEPGYAPYEKTIPHELHAMQEIVGGLITAIYPYEEPVGIVANDEGLLLGMDFNRSVEGGYGILGGIVLPQRISCLGVLQPPSNDYLVTRLRIQSPQPQTVHGT